MLIVGCDRRLAGLAFILSVIVGANGNGLISRLVALALFLAMWSAGRRLSAKDPNIYAVFNLARKQKALYDPMKVKSWSNFRPF